MIILFPLLKEERSRILAIMLKDEQKVRKKTELSLSESEEYNRTLFLESTIGLLLNSMDGKFVDANSALCKMVGRSLEDVLKLTYWDLTPEKYQDLEQEQLKSLAETGKYGPYEKDYIHKEGHLVPVRLQGKILERNGIKYIWSSIEDITKDKFLENEANTSNAELQTLNAVILTTLETLDLKKQLDYILDMALKVVGLEGGTICLINPDNTLSLSVYRETSKETIACFTENQIKIGDCLCGNCARDCRPLILKNRDEVLKYATHEALRGEDIRFHAAFPFVIGQKCVGVLCVFTRTDNHPADRSLKFLEMIVAQTAVTIDHVSLYEDLKVSEERFSAIFKAAPGSMILSTLPDGKTVEVNENFSILTGYNREEILGKNTADLNMWANATERDHFLSILQTEGVVHDFEADLNHKSGSVRNGLLSGHIISNEGKKYLLGTFYDITDRKLAEKSLRESERSFHETLENIQLVSVQIDLNGKVIYCNPFLWELTGYTKEEIIGKDWFNLFVLEDHLEVKRLFLKELENGDIESFYENPILTKNGSERIIRFSNTILRDLDGIIIGMTSIGEDITDRKLAEETILRNEVLLRLFVEHSPASIAMFDNEMKYIVVSNRYLMDYDLGDVSLIGRSHYEVFPDLPDDWREIHKQCLAGETIKKDEDMLPRANGKMDWVRWEIRPWFENSTEIGGIILFSEVITERKQAEKDIINLNRIYAVISQINQAIVRIRDADELFAEVCNIAVKHGNFQMAWIGLVDDETKQVQPVCFAGVEDGYLSIIKKITIGKSPEGNGPTGTAIREGKHYACDDIENDPNMFVWKDEAMKRGYRSSIALPISIFGKVIGAFTLYANAPHFFDKNEIELLDGVANDISFALETIDNENKRKQAVEALRDSEEKFRRLLVSTPLPIVYSDKEGVIIFRNDRFLKVFGYSETEMPTINEWWTMAYPDPNYREWVIQNWESAVNRANETNTDIESAVYQVTCKDNSIREIIISGIIINDNLLVTFIDITDRKRAEDQIQEQLNELRRWYDVMLDREERVLELKKEVNGLLAETGKPLRYASGGEASAEDLNPI